MTGSVAEPLPWPEQWATQLAVDIGEVRQHIAIARTHDLDPEQEAIAKATENLLNVAAAAVRRRPGRRSSRARRTRSLFDRWRGASVERAFQSVHAAQVFLIDLLPEEEVRAQVPGAVGRVRRLLGRDDPRAVQAEALLTAYLKDGSPPAPVNRAQLKQVVRVGYAASDQAHARVRDFRNILLIAGALIFVLMGILTLVVSDTPDAMPLCFSSSNDTPPAAGQTANPGTVCPSGDQKRPSSGDVAIVAGLGLLGGALAAAFAIRNVRGSSSPYGVSIALACLKVPSGALTAVAGILLLGGNFVPGFSELDSQRQILAYALVLGYAQQLATRFIDDRARSLVDRTRSQPTGPAPAPAAPPAQ